MAFIDKKYASYKTNFWNFSSLKSVGPKNRRDFDYFAVLCLHIWNFQTIHCISVGYFVSLIARFGLVGGRKGAGGPGEGPTGVVLGAKSSFGGGIP